MPRESLEELLRQLHQELERSDELPEDTVQRLGELREEIHAVLQRSDAEGMAPAEDLGSRLGEAGSRLGYPVLYLVLAATGAQAQLRALWSTPVWIALGAIVVLVHGSTLLLAGRLFRIRLGILATASQANLGGLVSGPLVGAVYHRTLAPIGLLLAVAGNALGTYVGLLAATLARLL